MSFIFLEDRGALNEVGLTEGPSIEGIERPVLFLPLGRHFKVIIIITTADDPPRGHVTHLEVM